MKTERAGELRLILFVFFLVAIFFSAFLPAAGQSAEPTDIISVEKNRGFEEKLRPLGLDLLFEWEGRTYILVRPQDLRALNELAVPYLLESHRFPALRAGQSLLQSSINGEYHSYGELKTDLEALQNAYPQLARIYNLGATLENREILALKISDNVSLDEEEAEVLFLGCHHAREWISVEVPFLLAGYLLENYGGDPEIRRLVDQSEIWIVPLVNPDGLEYSIRFFRYWRKNRRLNSDGSYGIDINRNYDYKWAYDEEGSSGEPASEVYRGAAPFSEPETQAVRDLFLQKNFQAMVSYHSYSQLILYPWGYINEPSDKDEELRQIAATMADLMLSVNGRVYEYGQAGGRLYVTNGDTTDWTFGIAGIPSYTIELPPIDQLEGGFFNAEADIRTIFQENLPAALYLIRWSIQKVGFSAGTAPENRRSSALSDRGKTPNKNPHFKN